MNTQLNKKKDPSEQNELDKWLNRLFDKPGYLILYLIGFLAIFFVFFPILFTRDMGLESFKDTGQIGDTFGGIFGPWVALLGVVVTFFAFYMQVRANELQRKALNDANENFQKQQAETTFFNLLEYHDRILVNISIDTLKSNYEILAKELKIYRDSISSNRFRRIEHTLYHPNFFFSRNSEIYTLIKNVVHIIDFISNKLNDDIFFHQVLLNTIREDEKFFLGMTLENKILTTNSKYNSEYAEHFISKTSYRNTESHRAFAGIAHVTTIPRISIYSDNLHSIDEHFQTSFTVYNSFLDNLILREVEISVREEASAKFSKFSPITFSRIFNKNGSPDLNTIHIDFSKKGNKISEYMGTIATKYVEDFGVERRGIIIISIKYKFEYLVNNNTVSTTVFQPIRISYSKGKNDEEVLFQYVD